MVKHDDDLHGNELCQKLQESEAICYFECMYRASAVAEKPDSLLDLLGRDIFLGQQIQTSVKIEKPFRESAITMAKLGEGSTFLRLYFGCFTARMGNSLHTFWISF